MEFILEYKNRGGGSKAGARGMVVGTTGDKALNGYQYQNVKKILKRL